MIVALTVADDDEKEKFLQAEFASLNCVDNELWSQCSQVEKRITTFLFQRRV